MRKTDARTVRSSGSLSIANDGSEPQFSHVKVPITVVVVFSFKKEGGLPSLLHPPEGDMFYYCPGG